MSVNANANTCSLATMSCPDDCRSDKYLIERADRCLFGCCFLVRLGWSLWGFIVCCRCIDLHLLPLPQPPILILLSLPPSITRNASKYWKSAELFGWFDGGPTSSWKRPTNGLWQLTTRRRLALSLASSGVNREAASNDEPDLSGLHSWQHKSASIDHRHSELTILQMTFAEAWTEFWALSDVFLALKGQNKTWFSAKNWSTLFGNPLTHVHTKGHFLDSTSLNSTRFS